MQAALLLHTNGKWATWPTVARTWSGTLQPVSYTGLTNIPKTVPSGQILSQRGYQSQGCQKLYHSHLRKASLHARPWWSFLLGEVSQPILGADLLSHFRLLADLTNGCLVDAATSLTAPQHYVEHNICQCVRHPSSTPLCVSSALLSHPADTKFSSLRKGTPEPCQTNKTHQPYLTCTGTKVLQISSRWMATLPLGGGLLLQVPRDSPIGQGHVYKKWNLRPDHVRQWARVRCDREKHERRVRVLSQLSKCIHDSIDTHQAKWKTSRNRNPILIECESFFVIQKLEAVFTGKSCNFEHATISYCTLRRTARDWAIKANIASAGKSNIVNGPRKEKFF